MNTPNLVSLHRIAAKLPPGSLLDRLESVITRLATPAFFSTSDGQIFNRQTHIEDARRELGMLLRDLRAALPSDPDVRGLDD